MSGEAEWDVSKENFVPVRQGRPTSALVAMPLSVRKDDRELEEAKSSFLAEISSSEDPLPAWLKYIKWTQDKYSTQASRKELTQVLEAATKALSSMACYQQDVRLLRLWVQYADCLPDPNSVFLFLEDHSIGRDHALFYEAYAAYLELKGNFSQAELVYQEGINRLAKPLERLKVKHAGFNQRMAKRRERQESEAALGMGPASADPTATRSSLAPLVPLHTTPQLDENGAPLQQQRLQTRTAMGLPQQQPASVALGVRPPPLAAPSTSRGSSSRPPAGTGAASLFAPVRSGTGSQQRSNVLLLSSLGVPGASSSSSSNAAPRQLDIHVDEEFGPKGQGPLPTAFPPAQQLHGQLPGLAVATKENSSQPAAWAGTKLNQQGVFAAPVSNKLEVFEDDDEDSEGGEGSAPEPVRHASQQQQPQHSGINPLLAPLAPAAAAAAAVKPAHSSAAGGVQHRHPPQVTTTAAGSSKLEGPLQAPSAPKQQHGSTSSSDSKAATSGPAAAPRQGYFEALLVGADGQEQSFEEVRAAVWRKANSLKQHQPQQQQQQQPAADDATASGQDHVANAQGIEAHATAGTSQGGNKAASSRARQPLGARSASPELTARDAPPLPAQQSAAQSAAATTAAVAAAVPTNNSASSTAGRSSSSSRRPFGAPLAPVSSVAVSAGPSSAEVASTRSPVAAAADDSGITINTRAAFDAMNGMFGGGDDTTTMHGFGRAAAGATAMHRPAAAADAGGVTVNTRAALDAMNGMFGGSDDTTTMHGFGRATARSRRSTAAADMGGVTINTRAAFDAMNGMFGGDDTTTMHGFGRAAGVGDHSSVGADAGVTVNTRAAFDYMNGVFGGAGDVTQTAAFAGRKGARKTSRLSVAPAAASATNGGSGQAAPLGVYEDTEMIGGPGMGPADMGQGGMFGVYEDTEFVGAKMSAAAGSSGRRSGAAMPGSGGLGLYEDTDFITHHVGGAAAGSSGGHSMAGPGSGSGGAGMGLYEDTDFITRPVGGAGGSSNGRQGGGQGMAGLGGSDGLMGLYEDTEFITRTVGSSGQGGAGAAGAALGEPGAGLGVYEDTEFVMRPVPPAAANSGGSSSSMLRSKLNRLSLANEALYRGQGMQQQQQGSISSRDGEHTGGGSSLGLYEDTEFMIDTVRRDSSSTGGALDVCADTEFLTKPVSAAAAAGHAGSGQQLSGRALGNSNSSSWDPENVPAASDTRQQQQQGRSNSCGPQPVGVHAATGMAPAGLCGSGSGSILQQREHAYGAAGPSRFGPSSVPGSPLGPHSRPGSAATTPSRPPRTPGTPGAALGPLARHMDSFEVMESPAVREAMAGRPLHPGTAGSSPAGSLASSPGCGASENMSGPGFEGKLQPRSLADRSTRAAALQPISAVRAEQLGVQVDPNAVLDDDEDGECDQQQQKGMVRKSPGRALRSLHFGREPGPAARQL